MKVRDPISGATRPAFLIAASVCLLVQVPTRLAASDPLALIPADMPAVVGFRDVATCADKLEAFIRKIDPGFEGFDLDEIQRGFNLADGVVDTSAPIFLVLARPRLHESAFVLVFKPREVASFSAEDAQQAYLIRSCTGPEGSYNLMLREGWVFVSPSRLALRNLRRVPAERSLARMLDDRQQAILAESNLFLYVPLNKWRERIQPYVFLGTHLIKLGTLARSEPGATSETTLAVLDWFAEGARLAVNQLDSLLIGASFDGDTFRLIHHHSFIPGQSAADYLGQVRRRGYDWASGLPDRPFFLLGGVDWQCPPELSLSGRFNEYVFTKHPAVIGKLSSETRQRLLESSKSCYGHMWGSYFMVTSPATALRPIQVLGGYAVDDADETIKELVYLQEHAGEVVSAFTGEQIVGKFEERRENGRPFYELRFGVQDRKAEALRRLAAFYGDGVRIQLTVLDSNHILYATATPPAGVDDLLQVRRSGQNVGANPAVRRLLSRLPADANALVVVDAGRCLSALPFWLHNGRSETAASAADVTAALPCPDTPGPMIGWACTVQADSLTGYMAIDANDVVRLVRLVKEMIESAPAWNTDARE